VSVKGLYLMPKWAHTVGVVVVMVVVILLFPFP
jgi:hypothetical protein